MKLRKKVSRTLVPSNARKLPRKSKKSLMKLQRVSLVLNTLKHKQMSIQTLKSMLRRNALSLRGRE